MAKDEKKTEEKVKKEVDSQNGVTRPKEGSKSRAIWDVADSLAKEGEETPTAKKVMEHLGEDYNQATVNTQVGRWRQYHGLVKSRKKGEDEEDED